MADELSREEVSRLIDERIARVLGGEGAGRPKELDLSDEANLVAATPSVLSIVRATAYAMC